ncbi:MAG: transposase [Selenomonadaceae bacterium]|jgi:transposase|nr:transposase [Selenomonadaceae bacterium]
MNEHLKGNKYGRIRYDDSFKQNALSLITEQKMPLKQVSKELGVSTDTLRTWIKKAGLNPAVENRSSLMNKKIRDLEFEIKNLKKELAQKNDVIDILKKSIGIIYSP